MLILIVAIVVVLISLLVKQTTPATPPVTSSVPVPTTPQSLLDSFTTLLNSFLGLFGLSTQTNPAASILVVSSIAILLIQTTSVSQRTSEMLESLLSESRSLNIDPTWYVLVGTVAVVYFLLQQPATPPATTPAPTPVVPLPEGTPIPEINQITRVDQTQIVDEEVVGSQAAYAPGCFRQESQVVNDAASGITRTTVKTFGISNQNGTNTWELIKQ